MKSRDVSAPELARSVGTERHPRTEELDLADADDDDLGLDDARPRPIRDALETAEVDVSRDRRPTLMSGIPAKLAESMGRERPRTPRRDPAAPLAERREDTRRVGDSDSIHSGPSAKAGSAGDVAGSRQRAAQRIDEARAAMDAGDLGTAVLAAEAALREADEAPAPGIVEVIEPARPLLNRVLATYVGPSSGLAIRAPKADDVMRRLGEREVALLRRIDGQRTLEELFDGSGLGSTEALRVVARLIRMGAIRIV
jgi:hypothetical protein